MQVEIVEKQLEIYRKNKTRNISLLKAVFTQELLSWNGCHNGGVHVIVSTYSSIYKACKNRPWGQWVNFSKEFILYVSIYMRMYNALYARGAIHDNTTGVAHKK